MTTNISAKLEFFLFLAKLSSNTYEKLVLNLPSDNSILRLLEIVRSFRDKRNWSIYHKPKDLAISITIEAAELLELFQWLSDEDIE